MPDVLSLTSDESGSNTKQGCIRQWELRSQNATTLHSRENFSETPEAKNTWDEEAPLVIESLAENSHHCEHCPGQSDTSNCIHFSNHPTNKSLAQRSSQCRGSSNSSPKQLVYDDNISDPKPARVRVTNISNFLLGLGKNEALEVVITLIRRPVGPMLLEYHSGQISPRHDDCTLLLLPGVSPDYDLYFTLVKKITTKSKSIAAQFRYEFLAQAKYSVPRLWFRKESLTLKLGPFGIPTSFNLERKEPTEYGVLLVNIMVVGDPIDTTAGMLRSPSPLLSKRGDPGALYGALSRRLAQKVEAGSHLAKTAMSKAYKTAFGTPEGNSEPRSKSDRDEWYPIPDYGTKKSDDRVWCSVIPGCLLCYHLPHPTPVHSIKLSSISISRKNPLLVSSGGNKIPAYPIELLMSANLNAEPTTLILYCKSEDEQAHWLEKLDAASRRARMSTFALSA